MIDHFFEKSPLDDLESQEFHNLILDFSTYVCILRNKKMNFPSIFTSLLESDELLDCYMQMCGFDDKRQALREFLKIDEGIAKSKFIKKVINK